MHAVVVPESVKQCADVLAASSHLVNHTPCPFGLSVYAWEPGQPHQPKQQTLIYVSDRVARDRAPEKNVMNGMGVRPGWYLIARPGRFKVHASWVKLEHYGLPWEDGLSVGLELDGQNTNQQFNYKQAPAHSGYSGTHTVQDSVFEGYMDQVIPIAAEGIDQRRQVFRPFVFEKSSSGLETKTVGPTDIGTITLKVKAGVCKPTNKHRASTTYAYSAKQASAKEAAREGRSMKVSLSQCTETRSVRYCSYRITDSRSLPEADITIFVRERSWLCSRRLIDDNDQPITFSQFQKLLKEVKPTIDEIVNIDDEPPTKKPKIKEQMVLIDGADPIQPGEVIDLT